MLVNLLYIERMGNQLVHQWETLDVLNCPWIRHRNFMKFLMGHSLQFLIQPSIVAHHDFCPPDHWLTGCWANEVIGCKTGSWAADYKIYIKTSKCAWLEMWRSIQYLVYWVYWWKWGMLSQLPLRQEAYYHIQRIDSHEYKPPLPFEKKTGYLKFNSMINPPNSI